jgi:hypothetical protein
MSMFPSPTVPAAAVAVASAITKVDSSTSARAMAAPSASVVQSAPQAASYPVANSVATTAVPAASWFRKSTAATVPSLPALGPVAKAHDAAIQSWTAVRSPKNLSWLAASYNVYNQSESKDRSSITVAVDEAIVRYSK